MKFSTLLVFSIGCASVPPKIERPPDLQKLGLVVLAVHCPTMPPNDRIMGTGVIVSSWKIVTAAHVVNCVSAEVMVAQPGGTFVPTKVEMIDFSLDLSRLVLVKATDRFADIVPVRIGHVTYGDRVCVVTAFPTHDRRCGLVDDVSSTTIDSSPNVEPGNSGSPVYDTSGRLVGIVTDRRAGHNNAPAGNGAVRLEGREWVVGQ